MANTNENPTLNDVFTLLDGWRHLPSYKLEPRVDPFFAIFLRPVLSRHLGVELDDTLIPELPLRRGTIYGEDTVGPNQSKKVDFLLRSADRRTLYLVELKTDPASRREEQDDYLARTVKVGWQAVVEGIAEIASHTSSEYLQKYGHLLRHLERMGYLEVPSDFYEHAFPEVRRGVSAELATVSVTMPEGEPALRVIYVQPNSGGAGDAIGFEEVAYAIEGMGELGARFAERLRGWLEKAGSSDARAASISLNGIPTPNLPQAYTFEIIPDPTEGVFTGIVVGAGAITQADTLEELRIRIREALWAAWDDKDRADSAVLEERFVSLDEYLQRP